jgi:hypothetical protein
MFWVAFPIILLLCLDLWKMLWKKKVGYMRCKTIEIMYIYQESFQIAQITRILQVHN